jgi:RNA polymerase sigma-70 factor (ECF subfamily)
MEAPTTRDRAYMRSGQEADLAIEEYADTVRRICFIHLKNYHDAEDVFQEVFLKYVLHDKAFQSKSHEKAWLIRVTINACKDTLRSFFRKNAVELSELLAQPLHVEDDQREVLEAVLSLPSKYKDVVYLHYFEGYSAVEIADMLQRNVNTVYTWLSRARMQLKTVLGGEVNE